MAKKRNLQLVLAGVTLAAGFGVAFYLSAGSAGVRPKEGPVRVAFAAPAVDGDRPAPSHYEAQVQNLYREQVATVSPLAFTMVPGPVDSHVVWLILDNQYRYLVRVRGVSATGAAGVWSDWSDPYTKSGPPEPPAD